MSIGTAPTPFSKFDHRYVVESWAQRGSLRNTSVDYEPVLIWVTDCIVLYCIVFCVIP